MYNVILYKGNYSQRQRLANRDNCIAYCEAHFNSSPRAAANYTCVIVGINASRTSKEWGAHYASQVGSAFNVPLWGKDGVVIGGFGGRGNYNLVLTAMPAILIEPLFCSNPEQADIIKSEQGQSKLAMILADSIKRFFPHGNVGFSVGHKYKTSRPKDRGAKIYGGGFESDFAEVILMRASKLLNENI